MLTYHLHVIWRKCESFDITGKEKNRRKSRKKKKMEEEEEGEKGKQKHLVTVALFKTRLVLYGILCVFVTNRIVV